MLNKSSTRISMSISRPDNLDVVDSLGMRTKTVPKTLIPKNHHLYPLKIVYKWGEKKEIGSTTAQNPPKNDRNAFAVAIDINVLRQKFFDSNARSLSPILVSFINLIQSIPIHKSNTAQFFPVSLSLDD